MELRVDYKKTDLGIIPSTWEVKKFSETTKLITCGIAATPKYVPETLGYPFLSSTNVKSGKIVWSNYKFIDSQLHRQLYRNNPPLKGDILYSRVGTIGEVAVVDVDFEFSIYVSLTLIKPNGNLDSRFLMHLLDSFPYRQRAKDQVYMGGGVGNLNVDIVRNYPIPIPELREQTAIANALSDAGALIGSLQKLIAKKRQIKQGAMQTLLTGEKRIFGFNGEWIATKLGELIESCSSGATPYRGNPEFYKGNINWINSGELNYNVIVDTREKITIEAVEKANLKIHPIGTFLIAITGLEAAGTRGSCGVVGVPSATNQSCMAIYPKPELTTEFLFHYYVLMGDSLALKYCQGTKQQSYTAKIVKLLPISIPQCVDEQRAIAKVLSEMDDEITTLETKLAKYQQIKQGMMQNLLTGRIRLV